MCYVEKVHALYVCWRRDLPNRFSSECKKKSPTSSQTSALSKLPMVTSNAVALFFFVHAKAIFVLSDSDMAVRNGGKLLAPFNCAVK